jgi:hypothetical protein
LATQRLVAQALGHFRCVVTILTGNLKPSFNVFSLSLGQVACGHVLGAIARFKLQANVYGQEFIFCISFFA